MTKLIMLVGIPGSGKSTLGKKLSVKESAALCSSDEIRKELYGDENIKGDNSKVFGILRNRIKMYLKDNVSVIYDATNLSRKKRMNFLKEIEKYNVFKECYIVATPYEKCLQNNQKRERFVPEPVIERMYKSWQTPSLNEGFDKIITYYNTEEYKTYLGPWNEAYKIYNNYEQRNPHHKETLNEHVQYVYNYVKKHTADVNCRIAAYLHDIGKPFCRIDKNKISHYYGHENVGAYDVFFYSGIENKLITSLLINCHMGLYNFNKIEENKLIQFYKNILGDYKYKQLCIIHNGDIKGSIICNNF